MGEMSGSYFKELARRDTNKLTAGVASLGAISLILLLVGVNAGGATLVVVLLASLMVAAFVGAWSFVKRLINKMELDSFEEGMCLVMEGAPANCTITDEKGAVLYCNERALKMFGASRQDYARKLFTDFLPEIQPDGTPSMERAGRHIEKAFREGTDHFEWWHQMGPGQEQFPCRVDLAAADVYGKKRVMVFNTDLRRTYEIQRQEESFKKKMQAILDSSPIVCAHYDEKGNILEVNKEAENLFGIPDKQVFIDNLSRFFPKTQPDGADSIRKNEEMSAKAAREGSIRYEWTYLHSDGTPIPTEELMQCVDMDGKTHLFVYSRDLREHYKTLEKERVVQGKIQAMLEQLGDHVQEQTSAVASSSSATEEMIANIRSVTDTLSKNTQSVKELQESSEAGHASLSKVVADIQGIARESESLLEINAVMQNIASQTNLLSMNAAIEAAHAGEAGRGFAVVADEIRKLAESSSRQSKTIGGVLKSIKGSIDEITKSTGVVQGRFNAIGEGVQTVAIQEDNVLNAMEEQGQGSKQILQAIGKVNETSHQVKEAARRMVETTKEALHKTDAGETAAHTDELTGVRNREYFNEHAEQELRYCVDEGRDFHLLMFGVDNLRQVSDVHGDVVRDDVLKVLVQRIRNSLKQGTLFARYDEGEFVVTLPNVRRGTALKLVEQAQKKVKDAPFAVKGLKLDVTISLGLASKTNSCKTLRDVIGNAERALSNAKATGKNKMVAFG